LASIIRIYHDARSSECQIQFEVSSAAEENIISRPMPYNGRLLVMHKTLSHSSKNTRANDWKSILCIHSRDIHCDTMRANTTITAAITMPPYNEH